MTYFTYVSDDGKPLFVNNLTTLSAALQALPIEKGSPMENAAKSAGLGKIKPNCKVDDIDDIINAYKGKLKGDVVSMLKEDIFYLRDYIVMGGFVSIFPDQEADANCIKQWYNTWQPQITDRQFLAPVFYPTTWFGWVINEEKGITALTELGPCFMLASDYCRNLSTMSCFPKQNIKRTNSLDTSSLPNKHYVAFVVTDGDNLAYCEYLATNTNLWAHQDRGKYKVGWELNPLSCRYSSTYSGLLL